jgi:hypothetical protein
MDIDERLKYLQTELDNAISRVSQKRDRERNRAFTWKVLSVSFAAAITVLLGLQVNGILMGTFRNIALILGATITVLNAVEAFYDERSLWINRTITLTSLYTLKRDTTFYALNPAQGEEHVKTLNLFKQRFDQINENEMKSWLKLRGVNELERAVKVPENK